MRTALTVSLVGALVIAGCSGTAPADPTPVPTPSPIVLEPAPSPAAPIAPSPNEAPDESTVEPYGYPELPAAEHEEVCAQTVERPSPDPCSTDADCRICHDGSNCGIPANLETLRTRGAACTQPDAAECEYAAVRCCSGHCRVVSH